MARPLRITYPGAFYHITSRGNERKAILVEKDAYAKELSRYIHLNPVRAGIVAKPEAYEWTSYVAYVGAKPSPKWLYRGFILGCFSPQKKAAQKRYKAFVESILGRLGENPLKHLPGGMILGRPQFVETIRAEHLSGKLPGRDLPALKELQVKPQASHIEAMVDRIVEGDAKLARNLKIYFTRQHSGTPLKAIGERHGLGELGVSQVSRRLDKRKADDAALQQVMAKIDRAIQS